MLQVQLSYNHNKEQLREPTSLPKRGAPVSVRAMVNVPVVYEKERPSSSSVHAILGEKGTSVCYTYRVTLVLDRGCILPFLPYRNRVGRVGSGWERLALMSPSVRHVTHQKSTPCAPGESECRAVHNSIGWDQRTPGARPFRLRVG